MNPNDQHVAISEAMGWRIGNPENSRLDYRWWIPPSKEPRGNEMFLDRPPDWLKSLDAIFDAIKTMKDDQKDEVVRRIGWSAVRGCWDNSFIANATPAQWSRAFLQTLSLWVDSSDAPPKPMGWRRDGVDY